ncbi:pathogenesis-related protein PR-1-like [Juglans microcarpa x Juglans regia]|uniref:pathogenesis-related protein PR-1-like n=1 Tax=Juglans microcarpa x Juglans regia TaxID=2249226 RepID=UPI001B7DA38D|nr:pathogenesis-related protein PR-1-like [Juglans microcarpa x Juglans regia]
MQMKSVMKPSEFLQMRMYLCSTVTIFLLIISSTHAVTKQGQYLSLANQFLAPHNAARSTLRLRPLMWDPKLARYAQCYANQRRFDCALRHSNGPYGENIFWGSGNGWTASQAVTAWVSERKWYNYRSNSCAGGQQCGHFTQIVWRTTRRVGCARVICSVGRGVFMTCNYDPPGNYIGERPY